MFEKRLDIYSVITLENTMAEMATKKSINVVSNKKSEVCNVQSNNDLIDLDDLTASNNQLISLCDDDDLVLTKNTHNALDGDDKSLQELIDSELALRICSSKSGDKVVTDNEESEEIVTRPETIKRIILDHRQNLVDVNAKFITAENEHCSFIEESCAHQNSYVCPNANDAVIKSELMFSRDEEKKQVFIKQSEIGYSSIIIQKTSDENDQISSCSEPVNNNDINNSKDSNVDYQIGIKEIVLSTNDTSSDTCDFVDDELTIQQESFLASMICPKDKYQQEEKLTRNVLDDTNLSQININEEKKKDVIVRGEQVPFSDQQTHQSFDNLDKKFYQQHQSSDKQECNKELMNEHINKFDEFCGYSRMKEKEDEILISSISQSKFSLLEMTEKTQSKLKGKLKEDPHNVQSIQEQFKSCDNDINQCKMFMETTTSMQFSDTERHALGEEALQKTSQILSEIIESMTLKSNELTEYPKNIEKDTQNLINESLSNELSESDSSFLKKVEITVSDTNMICSDTKQIVEKLQNLDSWTTVEETTKLADTKKKQQQNIRKHDVNINEMKTDDNKKKQDFFALPSSHVPLATSDEMEISDVSNICDTESREETTINSFNVSSSKSETKMKKKKTEDLAANSVTSPNLTRTKKTKKSKKGDLGKENISVNCSSQDSANMHTSVRRSHLEMINFSNEDDLSNVNVKSLTENYVSETNRSDQQRLCREQIATGISIKQLKSSFSKFDALTKKPVLHVRSVDAGKVQQQLNCVGQNGDANTNCRSCGKVVFQMEQTKAEGLVWHKNCFRCVQCSKQLNVDNYESHESTLYCKPHFKELFQPKPVEESEQLTSDKPDLGLEELLSLNVKSRFEVFEKASTESTNEIEKSPSQIAVKRSPSILSKLAKFQAKGMDIGVADESLNGIPYEESSESEDELKTEQTEGDLETEIVKAKRNTRERPISFSKMDDIKNRWESTSQQGRREIQREARKEEIAGIRSRLFMGKQGKMKEMYQQAVAGSDRVTKINAAEEIQHSTNHARSLKEKFERGEPIAASDDETDNKPKPEKADEEVIAAGISKKSRSHFLELDASAAKAGGPVAPIHPKPPTEIPRRVREAFMGRQVSDDMVRSSDITEEIHVETSEISNKFKFFESYKEPEKQRKQFRITPPRDGQVKMDSPDREIYRDPDVIRADDKKNEVVHTDTAKKMLSIFRQMEENACKEEVPEGPKPLKCFTPPPENKFAKATASDTEEDEDEDEESDDDKSIEERDPNYVRASDKVEDKFLKQAQNAARAKSLRAKFEHWKNTEDKIDSHHIEIEMAQSIGEQSSIESTSSLRARFESLGSQTNELPRTPKVKVNRFVEVQTTCVEVCENCQKKVYPLEKVETNNKIFHKQCFRCLQCNCILRMDSFTLNNGKLYCIPHFKQLFITRGNYDEGFGIDPHKNRWTTANFNNSTNSSVIAISSSF
ncbi:interaptin isoform X4 [Ooceraea biroi]|uniref:interaptin isoform X4 n=1 Tax=Ooceraea biroi TaxID=2015173 RepID=UPI000F0851B0|nr:interaptin isoform X4 [Ooceraea biroi]